LRRARLDWLDIILVVVRRLTKKVWLTPRKKILLVVPSPVRLYEKECTKFSIPFYVPGYLLE